MTVGRLSRKAMAEAERVAERLVAVEVIEISAVAWVIGGEVLERPKRRHRQATPRMRLT